MKHRTQIISVQTCFNADLVCDVSSRRCSCRRCCSFIISVFTFGTLWFKNFVNCSSMIDSFRVVAVLSQMYKTFFTALDILSEILKDKCYRWWLMQSHYYIDLDILIYLLQPFKSNSMSYLSQMTCELYIIIRIIIIVCSLD